MRTITACTVVSLVLFALLHVLSVRRIHEFRGIPVSGLSTVLV